MIAGLYRCASDAAGPVIAAMLDRRRAKGKEDPDRLDERRGIASVPRPGGPLVWIHAASVGEAVSMLSLADRLARSPGLRLLITTGTVTSARLLAGRMPAGAIHQYVPVDRIGWVRSFLDHWRPDLALWVESELWPNLVRETRRRRIPMLLVNARMSERSFRRWRWAPGLARDLLAGFDLCLAQSETAAGRLAALGAANVRTVGNLKFAADPLPADGAETARLAAAIGDRPRWLAVSTHAGEEEAAAAVHRAVARRHHGLLTIIVPRHPARGPAILRDLKKDGLAVALRSAGEPISADTDIYLADGMGELGLFFSVAEVVFVGGSLVGHGGHNPIEPARLGCAVLFGPHMGNFATIAAAFLAAGAARQVADPPALAHAVDEMLAAPDARAAAIAAGAALAADNQRVLDRVMDALAPYLARLAPPAPADARP